ncbi:MAG: transglutaminase-like domain-containing protein [Clostridiales bacterium]|jgi:transglutaminase-like putative cysteine protease|nr:transglutaminase-like domain-containing protein [Clostridiales bacterium]
MARFCKAFAAVLIFAALFGFGRLTARAATEFDLSQKDKGILTVSYDGKFEKKIRLLVQKDGSSESYQYIISRYGKINIPLQMGDGAYTALMLENIQGYSYRVLSQSRFDAVITDATAAYKVASPIVNYSETMEAIKGYAELLKDKPDERARIAAAYKDVVESYTYDDYKAANPTSDYVPVIDDIYKSKKAICYDYSAMLASVLRSRGVPARLIMGYAPEISAYHAWNELYIDDEWIVVDTTYDSAYFHAKQPYSMVKDGKLFRVMKVY